MTTATQETRILEMLRRGDRLTAYTVFLRVGSMRLGARIYDLKRKGYKIEKRIVKTQGGAHVAEYSIDRKHA
jgi:hypothetical protein